MDNCYKVTKLLLSHLNVDHTSKHIKDNIFSHPYHPSLLAISDTLKKYRIKTLAVKIEFETLLDMPVPSVVQLVVNNQPLFFVLKSISTDEVTYYDDNKKLFKANSKEFIEQWTGVCLLVEITESTKEKDIDAKINAMRFKKLVGVSLAIMLLIWIGLLFSNAEISLSTLSLSVIVGYSLFKVFGITVGVFLLWFDIDQYNPTLQNFCTGGSERINCNAVLNSKHAKIFNGALSLSLLSFSYFFGTFTYLLFSSFSSSALTVLSFLSFLTVPIIAISVYYQAIVIKQWCKFCILIQATLISEIILMSFSNYYKMPVNFESLPLLGVLILIPIIGWTFLKPLLKQSKEINFHKRALKKIKHNPYVLDGLLSKSRKIEHSTEGLGISLTNDTAKYDIVKVCNPYCGPCAMAHPIFEELLESGKINLQILFPSSISDTKNSEPIRHFLAINEHADEHKMQEALDDWYLTDKKDYSKFAHKYPVNGQLALQDSKMSAMREWCQLEHIKHTPTIFINGYQLPREYSVEDLIDVLQ